MFDKVIRTNCQPKFDQLKSWYIAKVAERIGGIKNDTAAIHKLQQLIENISSWSAETFSKLEVSRNVDFRSSEKIDQQPPQRIRYQYVADGPIDQVKPKPMWVRKCEEIVMECWDTGAALNHKIGIAFHSHGITAGPSDYPAEFTFVVPDMIPLLQQALEYEGIDFKLENQQRIETIAMLVFSGVFTPICDKIERYLEKTRRTMDAHVEYSCRHRTKKIPNKIELDESVKLLNDAMNLECVQKLNYNQAYITIPAHHFTSMSYERYYPGSFAPILSFQANDLRITIINRLTTLNKAVQRVEYEIMFCIRN